LFLGVYYNFSVWFKITDKTYFGTLFTAGGALITVLANYLLIPVLGYLGSALAALLCYAGMAAACYIFGQKYFPVPYTTGKSLLHIVCAVGYSYLVTWYNFESTWIDHAFHILATILYLFLLWAAERPALHRPGLPPEK
jgi:O-antigen/teichoic acid export membrane protein